MYIHEKKIDRGCCCDKTRLIYAYFEYFMHEIHIKQSCISGYKYILYAFRESPLCLLPKTGRKMRKTVKADEYEGIIYTQIEYLRYTNMFICMMRPLCGIYYAMMSVRDLGYYGWIYKIRR